MCPKVEFLLVESNPGDVRLTQECFKDMKISNQLNIVDCCIEALNYVQRQGQYHSVTLPDIVLISIAMLWENMGELVQQIKQEASLAHIPIVALTAFEGEEASLGANVPINLSISKPLNTDSITTLVRQIDHFGLVIGKAN